MSRVNENAESIADILDAAWASGRVGPDGTFHKGFDAAYWLLDSAAMGVEHLPVLAGWQMVPRPISAAQYRRSVPCGGGFFRHGLELLSHPDEGSLVCAQRVAIRLGHDPRRPVHFCCVLCEEGDDGSGGSAHDCCLVESHSSWTCIHVTAPPATAYGNGRWELRILVAPGIGPSGAVEDTYRSMEWCCSYRIDFGRNTTPAPSRFPYAARGVTLIAPTTRGVESGGVDFRLRWRGSATPHAVTAVAPRA